jgi:arginase
VVTKYLLCPEWQGYGVDAGVYHGAIAMAQALLPEAPFTTIDAPAAEALVVRDGILGLDSIAARFARTLAQLRAAAPDAVITVGGTCGIEAAPVAYLNERYQGDLAIVWFDAHGDLNTPASSPSGHFHGMVLRTLTGEGPREFVDALVRPLDPRQIFLAGTRDLDPGEAAFIHDAGVSVTAPESLAHPASLTAAVRGRGFHNVYLHVDLDCFRPEDVPDTLMRTPGGPAFDTVLAALRLLRDSFHVAGSSIVEYVDRGGGSMERIRKLLG